MYYYYNVYFQKGYLEDRHRITAYTIQKKKEATSQKAIKGNEGEGKGDYAKLFPQQYVKHAKGWKKSRNFGTHISSQILLCRNYALNIISSTPQIGGYLKDYIQIQYKYLYIKCAGALAEQSNTGNVKLE